MSKKKLYKKYKEGFSEYKSLLQILKKRKIKKTDFYKYNQTDVIDTAHIMAKKMDMFIKFNNINPNYKFIDIGCGLGQITNEVGKINGYKNTFACEPSKYASEFVKNFYPKINFLNGGIENIDTKYNNFFDVLYLKEVSPFRSNDFNLQKKLIKKLQKITKKNGIIILEQIRNKGKQDIYTNLNILNLRYKLEPTVPNFLLKNKRLRNFLLDNYTSINFLLTLLDKVYFKFLKKKTYYIKIYKN